MGKSSKIEKGKQLINEGRAKILSILKEKSSSNNNNKKKSEIIKVNFTKEVKNTTFAIKKVCGKKPISGYSEGQRLREEMKFKKCPKCLKGDLFFYTNASSFSCTVKCTKEDCEWEINF